MKHAVIRIDTDHYGVVLSTHRTAEKAAEACEIRCAELVRRVPDAIPWPVYQTVIVDRAKTGDRVRYA